MKTIPVFFIASSFFFSSNVFSQTVILDSTFGNNGIVVTDIGSNSIDVAYSTIMQPDGKFISAGMSNGDFCLLRHHVDGSIDSTFNLDGKVTTDLGTSADNIRDIAITPDSKIVAAGRLGSWPGEQTAIVRYTSDGYIDSTFSSDGILILDLGISDDDRCSALTIQTDGKILVSQDYKDGGYTCAIIRIKEDGTLDSTFSNDGISILDNLFVGGYGGGDVALQADGKIIIAGSDGDYDPHRFRLARLDVNGTIDSSFDEDGIVNTNFTEDWDYASSVIIQPDGKIVVAGTSDDDQFPNENPMYAIARYNTDGSLDQSFNGDGKFTFEFQGYSFGRSMALQADGKILFLGAYIAYLYTAHYASEFFRLTSDGYIDSTFDGNGVQDTSGTAEVILIQPDGKIVLGAIGHWDGIIGDKADFCLVRYLEGCSNVFTNFSYSLSELDVQFTDQNPNATTWLWDFGDGITNASQNPFHAYATEGSYNVCLIVTDTCGSDTFCQTISVCKLLNTDYLYTTTELSVQFLNQISEATSFSWNFDDGTTSPDQSPLHIFPSFGVYHVCLIEWDECASDTICKDISVIPVGSQTLMNDPHLTIFPNPFNDQIIAGYELMQASEVTFQLTDLSGKILYTFFYDNRSAGLHREELNFEKLAAGIYLLQFKYSEDLVSVKVIKQ